MSLIRIKMNWILSTDFWGHSFSKDACKKDFIRLKCSKIMSIFKLYWSMDLVSLKLNVNISIISLEKLNFLFIQ